MNHIPLRTTALILQCVKPAFIVWFTTIVTCSCMAQTRMIPHLTSTNGGFSTVITASNTAETQTFTVQPYSSTGVAFDPVSRSIDADEVTRYTIAELFGTTQSVSHFTITDTSTDVMFSIAYQSSGGPGSPAHLLETSESARRWRLFPGNWSLVFDGIAVVNLGDAATQVYVRQMAFDGDLIQELVAVENLTVHAKGLYVIGAPQGSTFSAVANSYFEIITTQPVALTALRGTPPGSETGYLWENSAIPLQPIDMGPLPLADIKYWAYQIQEVNLNQSVDQMVQSNYDMLVLEPTRTDWSDPNIESDPYSRDFNTEQVVERLKSSKASDGLHRKLVIAYIDIGQAEDWRWYWTWDQRSPDEDEAVAICNQTPFPPAEWPEYIVKCDPDNWLHNYPVKYWEDDWINIVIGGQGLSSQPYGNYNSIIDEVIKSGFDGIYLDWVEAAEDEDIISIAEEEGLDPVQEMIWFIEDMRNYAQQRNPNFIIIQQNAASLISNPELLGAIDAIAQEAIWYDGDATDNWNDPNGYDSRNDEDLVNYYLGFLKQYQTAGLPVFSCEYALEQADDAYQKAKAQGFIPYVTRRSLGNLTTTPPADLPVTPRAYAPK